MRPVGAAATAEPVLLRSTGLPRGCPKDAATLRSPQALDTLHIHALGLHVYQVTSGSERPGRAGTPTLLRDRRTRCYFSRERPACRG
jgi:hypothetical protein